MENSNEIMADSSAQVQDPNNRSVELEASAPSQDLAGSEPTVDSGASLGLTAPAKDTLKTGKTGRNWKQDYNGLVKLREQEQKNYNELRRKLVSQGTERNQFEKQVSELTSQVKSLGEAFAKATKQPYDPDQFMETLRTQGPDYILGLLGEREKAMAENFQKSLGDMSSRMRKMQVSSVVKDRRADSSNYPDFSKLEPTMSGIMEQLRADFKAGLLPNDPDNVDPEELTDYLYNLARLQHSQDAIKAAEAEGAQKARSELAREAETSVAGGGKNAGSSAPDHGNMSAAQIRKHFIDKGMVEGY